MFNKFMLPSFSLIRGRSYVFSPFLVDFLCSKKPLQNLFMISATWSVNSQMVLLFYMSLSSLSVKYSSTKRVAC